MIRPACLLPKPGAYVRGSVLTVARYPNTAAKIVKISILYSRNLQKNPKRTPKEHFSFLLEHGKAGKPPFAGDER